jgi:hypothetical protein
MKKIILFSIVSFLFSAVYDDGDIVSDSHQNLEKPTCYAGNGYEVDDNWSLSDWNGNTNGGSYNVTFLEMSTTW